MQAPKNMTEEKSPLVIFQHIPKTAGTSLRHAIQHQFKPNEVFEFYKIGDSQEGISKFLEFYSKKSKTLKIISSHLGFGLHQYIDTPVTYVTILREPTKRIISYYHHLVKLNHPEAVGKSLEEFVRTFGGVQNGMACNLSGVTLRAQLQDPDLDLEYERNAEQTLIKASENLKKHFCVVGLLEYFDETCVFLNQNLGWHLPLSNVKSNVGKKKKTSTDIPKETLDIITEYNKLDLQLYEQVKKQFQAELENLEYDMSLKLEELRPKDQDALDEIMTRFRITSNRLAHSLYQKFFVARPFFK